MKRILLSAALLLAVATTGFASQHATRAHHKTTLHAAANAACPDPAHCPLGSCPLGSKVSTAKVAGAVGRAQQDRSCSDPSKCPASCSRNHAGVAAAAVASR